MIGGPRVGSAEANGAHGVAIKGLGISDLWKNSEQTRCQHLWQARKERLAAVIDPQGELEMLAAGTVSASLSLARPCSPHRRAPDSSVDPPAPHAFRRHHRKR